MYFLSLSLFCLQGDKKSVNVNSTNIDLIKGIIAAGLFPQVRRCHQQGKKESLEIFLKDENGNKIFISGKRNRVRKNGKNSSVRSSPF